MKRTLVVAVALLIATCSGAKLPQRLMVQTTAGAQEGLNLQVQNVSDFKNAIHANSLTKIEDTVIADYFPNNKTSLNKTELGNMIRDISIAEGMPAEYVTNVDKAVAMTIR